VQVVDSRPGGRGIDAKSARQPVPSSLLKILKSSSASLLFVRRCNRIFEIDDESVGPNFSGATKAICFGCRSEEPALQRMDRMMFVVDCHCFLQVSLSTKVSRNTAEQECRTNIVFFQCI
jgi:hypothetical protein